MTTRQAWCAKCGDVVLCDERGCVACRVEEHNQARRTDSSIALAAFCAICIDGVIDLRPAQLEQGGPIFTVCKGCDEDGHHTPISSVPEKTGMGYRRCYQPIDEALDALAVRILRRIRHFSWVDPVTLADAVGIPSKDADPKARNRFDVEMSRLTRQGRLERVGEPMSFVYRITSAGRDEYEYRIGRSMAA